jgi:hypothetical protein
MKKIKMKNFYLGLLIPVLFCAIFLGFNALLLTRAGEYLSLDAILDKQEKTGGVYGSALYQRTYYYKQRMFDRYAPETVVIGSSRVLQMRAEDFDVGFVNLGSLSSLDEVTDLSHAVFESTSPGLVILGVDFWWFAGDGKAAAFTRDPPLNHLTLSDVFTPFSWYSKGKVTVDDIETILSRQSPNIGVSGIVSGDGHDRFGSHYQPSLWTGAAKAQDFQFNADLAKIKTGKKIYAWADTVDAGQWQKFIDLLDFYKQRKLRVTILVPPQAPTVAAAMEASGKYKYIAEMRRKIAEAGAAYLFPVYDYHDASVAGFSDCEFMDGHHGGPVVYKRLLLDMALRDEDLRSRVKLPELGYAIDTFKGQASTLPGEVDFLGLGCVKTPEAMPPAP